MRNRLLKFLLFAALLGAGAIHAQDQDQLQQQEDQSAAQEQNQAEEEQAEAQEESAEETEEAEENEGFERFIPTEQVSRDLGVSFPADI